MKVLKINSVETVSEVSQKSNVTIVTYVKTRSKGKANFKKGERQIVV